jgi:death on curing protein
MILVEDILKLHRLSIEIYGGAAGVRDLGLLESAIARPFQTFGGDDLYPTVFEKAAALGESLIINHPFVDGNKRTGFLAMTSFIQEEGFVFKSSQEDAYVFTIDISTGSKSFEEIVEWLKLNSTSN